VYLICWLQARPGFWDVIGRAKFDAWASLGTMNKHQAMQVFILPHPDPGFFSE
jgi:acyl-CoA-binding protein